MDLYEFFYKYKKSNNCTMNDFALELGVTRSHLTKVMKGHNPPSTKLALRAEEITNGKVKPWEMLKFFCEKREKNMNLQKELE